MHYFQAVLIVLRVALGLLVLWAIAAQFRRNQKATHSGNVNFFSYFTIQSNLFAAITFLVSALVLAYNTNPLWLDYFRGAAVLYLIVTGLVYIFLLANAKGLIPWVNLLLHYLFPLAVLLDWIIDPPRQGLWLNLIWFWLVYPLFYLVYTLTRGHLADWYPYPFVNVTKIGYRQMVINTAAVTVGMVILALIIYSIPNIVRLSSWHI